ncbi:hypothetical protein RKE29_19860 [Streptomyces sp. B1866]|uniref:phthiocerol/phthiodiolone dimycocerosyl transferase family protein n=1 Tax=Streptomyces sp. B1866 TaxID=3075431 RepID=UPI00288DBB36|nr:hypothetical protein [Streptomyces sp. B1866]MDT3398877.1 hypothetical protein [Streptomyces sp. B1866]
MNDVLPDRRAAGISAARPLDPIESLFISLNYFVGYSVRCRGRLDRGALDAAYQALCAGHPVLAGRVEPRDGRHFLVPGAGGGPVRVRGAAADDGPPATEPGDQYRGLSALEVAEHADGAHVTLLVHHCVADASAALGLLAELWDHYTRLAATGAPRPVRPGPLPAGPVAVLRRYGYEFAPPAGLAAPAPDGPAPAPDRPVGCPDAPGPPPLVRRLVLTRAETAALSARARACGVTLNGLLSGALLRANARARGWDAADSPVLLYYPVDLRTRLSPPVQRTEVTNLLGIALVVVGFARTLRERLRQDLESGRAFQMLPRFPERDAGQDAAAPVLSITNWGVIPRLPAPEELVISDFASTWPTAPPMRPTQPCGYVVHSFDGRLAVESLVPAGGGTVPAVEEAAAAAVREDLLAAAHA